ncbi:hypothetical protein LUZ62_020911 [Rhynchospora pubera]|uniref:Late embryogenesis abundant protein LEA-2 subgroup domain-containing protein n=1 Tax=Rhynchospora pubera TaxID=906938 RepID=A0AAV8GVG8_9POAL|nr:hypothetical protein LUZ62_040070 [Rhynchospora pubera]KAJ4808345.1 hypothetical protein LUZ62_020911 [Rhynchospora pubera]
MDYPSTKYRGRRSGCHVCCCICMALVVIIVAVLVTLGLTVFKIRDPTMTINSVSVKIPSGSALIPSNMEATTDTSVKNPNILALHFVKPDITAYYGDLKVGHTEASEGVCPARGTIRLKTKMNLNITTMMDDPRFAAQFVSGLVDLNSSAIVNGKVKVFGVISHHVDLVFNCTVKLDITTFSMKNQTCWTRMWFWKRKN